jgi:hypothetical protein
MDAFALKPAQSRDDRRQLIVKRQRQQPAGGDDYHGDDRGADDSREVISGHETLSITREVRRAICRRKFTNYHLTLPDAPPEHRVRIECCVFDEWQPAVVNEIRHA